MIMKSAENSSLTFQGINRMCEPTTLMVISIAMSAATTLAATSAQQQQAQAQADHQKQSADAAVANSLNQYASIQRRTLEEREAAAGALEENNIEAAQARARAKVAASAAGVTGLSTQNLIADIFNQEGRKDQAVRTNLSFVEAQLADQQQSIFAGAQSAVNQGSTPIFAPSYASAALKIGADSLGAYNTYFPEGGNPFASSPAATV